MQKFLVITLMFISSVYLNAQPVSNAPTPPARSSGNVKSLFSGAYTNIPGTDWFPNWGQTTVVSDTAISGNAIKKYSNLNYQGVQFASSVNVSGMRYLHLDIWTPNCTSFEVFLVNTSPATVEQKVTLTPALSGWNSFDIELSQYNNITLSTVDQLKFVGTTGSSVYLDNIYFYTIPGKPPVVNIISPVNNATYSSPATISISATASDSDGTVKKVTFYKNGTLLGVDSVAPFNYSWNNVLGGNYALTAKATDNVGLTTTSAPVNVVVTGGNGDGYCATATNLDYKYKASSSGGVVTFLFHPLTPIAGCTYSFIYLRLGLTGVYSGYAMTALGSDFIYTTTIADSTPVSIYFTYMVPSGGERNSSANPHDYKAGTNCTGIAGIPTVNLTAPLQNASYTEPANILLKATATDNNGTVSRVDFISGSTTIGSSTVNPYSFSWNNVPAGNYNLAAKVTDNDSITALSTVVKVVVKINNSMGFCDTIANGDYSYRAEKVNGNIVITFHPLTPILGCAYAFVYLREGLTGPYPGYAMTAIGSDFRYTKPVANGTPTSIYFTYSVPSGGERTSLLTPHSYTMGTSCLTALPVKFGEFTGGIKNNSIALKWITYSELNNDHFIVEKANAALQFSTFKLVESQNRPSGTKEYSVVDAQPFNGINYYKLSQVDRDGKKSVAGIIKLIWNGKSTDLTVYPNPLHKSDLRIIFNESVNDWKQITISDLSGKAIYSKKLFILNNYLSIAETKSLANGIYQLSIDGKAKSMILVKND